MTSISSRARFPSHMSGALFLKLVVSAIKESRAGALTQTGPGRRTVHTLHRQIEHQRTRKFGKGRYD